MSLIDLSRSTLTADQQHDLLALLQQYRDVFALSPDELGRTGIIKYTIDTADSPPIRLRPYRLSESKKSTVEHHVGDMLQRGIIIQKPLVHPYRISKQKRWRGKVLRRLSPSQQKHQKGLVPPSQNRLNPRRPERNKILLDYGPHVRLLAM